MASVTVQKMRSIDALVDQLVTTGVYNRAVRSSLAGIFATFG